MGDGLWFERGRMLKKISPVRRREFSPCAIDRENNHDPDDAGLNEESVRLAHARIDDARQARRVRGSSAGDSVRNSSRAKDARRRSSSRRNSVLLAQS